jgi:drug/metabolite transporter (DMT)-like permease
MSTAAAIRANYRVTEIALLLILATLWGSSYSFIKVGVETVPPMTLTAGRTLIGAAVLALIIRMRGIAWPRDAMSWRRLYFQGVLNGVLPFTLVAWAEITVDASLATILNSTTPLFAYLFTVAVFRQETLTARHLAGVLAGLAGVCLVVGLEALQGLGRELVSQLALIAAAVCYGTAAIFGRRLGHLDPMMSAAGTMLCAASIMLPLSLVFDRPWTLNPSAASVGSVVFLGVVSTALAYTINFRLLQTLGSVGATAQAYIRVPIGVAIGVAWLGEVLSPTVWIGLVCVVAGVAAMTMTPRTVKLATAS